MVKRVSWTAVVPLLALVVLALTWGEKLGPVLVVVEAVFLIGAVLAAVHHAEVVAARVGEPFGSLVLAAAVTVIEVALIVDADGVRWQARRRRWPGTPCSPR